MSKTSTKKPAPPPPPTVLVLTLQTDGTGALLTRRGELASLSSFTFQNMAGIVSAIEHGAAHLLNVEKNPPKDVPHTATSSSPTLPVPVESPELPAAEPLEPQQETVLDDTNLPAVEGSAASGTPAASALPLPLSLNGPLAGIIPETAQLNLF
jgi:hypothetical protein